MPRKGVLFSYLNNLLVLRPDSSQRIQASLMLIAGYPLCIPCLQAFEQQCFHIRCHFSFPSKACFKPSFESKNPKFLKPEFSNFKTKGVCQNLTIAEISEQMWASLTLLDWLDNVHPQIWHPCCPSGPCVFSHHCSEAKRRELLPLWVFNKQ